MNDLSNLKEHLMLKNKPSLLTILLTKFSIRENKYGNFFMTKIFKLNQKDKFQHIDSVELNIDLEVPKLLRNFINKWIIQSN